MAGRPFWVVVESPHQPPPGSREGGGVTSMNGRIANSTLPLRRLFRRRYVRTWLLALCCVMSLALLGAVRAGSALRPVALMAVEDAPLYTEWNEPPQAPRQQNDRVELGAPIAPTARNLETPMPAGAVPLKAAPSAPPTTASPVATAVTPAFGVPQPERAITGRRVRQLLMEVTAYCACQKCCGPRAQGVTASGRHVTYNNGRFVAADTSILKFNTNLIIPGYANNKPVKVLDRGGAIKGNKLDVFFASHQEARKWGRQKLWVTVIDE